MTVDLTQSIPSESIAVQILVSNWKEAITAAGELLSKCGITTDAYTNEMIQAVEKFGPYIVVAPNVAIAHSRPSPAVKRTGLSLVTLKKPIEFGSKMNDPVSLVVGLAATDHDSHMEIMAGLATILGNPAKVKEITEATEVATVSRILGE